MTILFEDGTKAAYSADAFIEPTELIELVRQKVAQSQKDLAAISLPLINFWGVVGSGKTWLLQHLSAEFTHHYESALNTCTSYINMADFELSDSQRSAKLVDKIATQLLNQFLTQGEPHHREQLQTASSSKKWVDLVTAIQMLAQNRCTAVLLIDHLDQVEAQWWETIESELLEPLLTSCQLLVITATRSPLLSRLQPELLRRQEQLQLTQLKPFTAVTLQTLSAPDTLKKSLWQYSGGNPWLAKRLISADEQNSFQETVAPIYDSFLNILLLSVPDGLTLYLHVVGILRYFRESALSHMLKHTGHQVPNKVKLGRILRQLAQNSDIVWWDKERAQYVSSVTARIILTQYQLVRDATQLIEAQQQAIEFYWHRLQNFDDQKVIVEIVYHQAWLHIAGEEAVREDDLWSFISKLEMGHQKQVRETLLADEDLKSLLSAQDYQALTHRFSPASV